MNWIDQFPGLEHLTIEDQKFLLKNSSVISVPKETVIFGPGKVPDNLLLLLDGTVRVQQLSPNGRQIVLYRVRAGESCVLTTACILSFEKYSAEGIAETDIEAVAIPVGVFDQLVGASTEFRRFVFTDYSNKIAELFHVIEDVAFQRIDVRLAAKIVSLSSGFESINITHQQLAAELGTVREVVSRQLSEFQRRNWISQSRGVIHIQDKECLAQLAYE